MHEVEVIRSPAAAAAALAPVRARILAELREPGSAAEVAQRVGLPRQKVNYHLRALEAHGLVALAEERRHGGLTERRLQATAAAYVVAPGALGAAAPDPHAANDRLSARYLIALGARLVDEVGALARRAHGGRRLGTLGVDAEIAFASAADQAAFARELSAAVTRLVAEHHIDGGRPHRLVVAVHPRPEEVAA